MPLQTRTVVAETFAYLRQGFELIETELTARALRLESHPEEANDVREVMENAAVATMQWNGRRRPIRSIWPR
jgi:hypothetical protein